MHIDVATESGKVACCGEDVVKILSTVLADPTSLKVEAEMPLAGTAGGEGVGTVNGVKWDTRGGLACSTDAGHLIVFSSP